MRDIFFVFILLLTTRMIYSQILDSENRVDVLLNNNMKITLFGAKIIGSEQKSTNYYYLPANLRIATGSNGIPQFLFIKYSSDDKPGSRDTSGAILHMLMEYGLNKQLESELRSKLRLKVPNANLLGPVDVVQDKNNGIQLISNLISTENNQQVILSKNAPTLPGSKIALSAKLNALNAQILDASFKQTKSITDLSISLYYKYTVIMPAVKGYIIEDWRKLDSLYDKEQISYKRRTPWWQTVYDVIKPTTYLKSIGLGNMGPIGNNSSYTYSELKDIYHQLEEDKIIQFVWEEYLSNDKIDKIKDEFFNYFKTRFTSLTPSAPTIDVNKEDREIKSETLKSVDLLKSGQSDSIKSLLFKAKSFTFKKEFYSTIKQRITNRIDLRMALPIERDLVITENILEWYNAVKHNPKCVTEVLASNPLYGNRDIDVLLDMEVREIFNKVINYASIEIRKKRSVNGFFDYSANTTFDKKTLESLDGNKKSFSISKIMENDVIPFEYRVKWSIKGGKDFYEQDSTWQVGDWLGITLQSPLQPVYLTFEPDVEQLKENMIRYVDLQIKYLQFGREIGKTIRIRSSFSGENIIDSFYIDKASPGYIYRLVFNHSYRGQLATEWQPNFDLEKVDGILPREIIENDEVSIKKFMEQAKKIETNIVIDTYAKMLNTAKPKR